VIIRFNVVPGALSPGEEEAESPEMGTTACRRSGGFCIKRIKRFR
jgi:hypothetical protein